MNTDNDARMTTPAAHICRRRFGCFLLITDPADSRFVATSQYVGTFEEMEELRLQVEGQPFTSSLWTRNPRAVAESRNGRIAPVIVR